MLYFISCYYDQCIAYYGVKMNNDYRKNVYLY